MDGNVYAVEFSLANSNVKIRPLMDGKEYFIIIIFFYLLKSDH